MMWSLMENVYYLLLYADDEKINVLVEEGRKASVQRWVACLHVARTAARSSSSRNSICEAPRSLPEWYTLQHAYFGFLPTSVIYMRTHTIPSEP